MSNFEHQESIFHLLLCIFSEKITGCLNLELDNTEIMEVWIDQGEIVTVTKNNYTLKQLIIKYSNFTERKINLISKDFEKQTIASHPKPFGYYLARLYDIDAEIIEQIFHDQITYLRKNLDFNLNYSFYTFENNLSFPFQEMTGLAQQIDDLLLDIFNHELDLKEWYLNYPASCFCLELNYSENSFIQKNKLSQLDQEVLKYADEKSTLNDISKTANISLAQVQKSAFILNYFGFIEYVLSPYERAKFSQNLFHNGEVRKDIIFDFRKNKYEKNLLIPPVVFLVTIIGLFLGVFQLLEFKVIDLFFLKHQEIKDTRITLVTVDDNDLEQIGKYPISDGTIAQALKIIKEHNPRVIGLNMYRNLSIEPGTKELAKIFQTTNNLIGVEKVIEPPINPNKILQKADRISFADLIVDSDGFIRRTLFSLEKDNQIKESFGTSLALFYLSPESISFKLKGNQYYLGQGIISPLLKSSGGYWNSNLGGYQIMLNYRGGIDKFNQITFSQILAKKFDFSLIKDKIIIVGSLSDADQDTFFTPESKNSQGVQGIPGIVIHANHVSQLVSSALDGRPLLKPRSKIEEMVFIFLVTVFAIVLCFALVNILVKFEDILPSWSLYLIIPLLMTIGILVCNYILFLQGWWLPTVSTVLSASISSVMLLNYLHDKSKHRMFFDLETSLPNRHFLKIFLTEIPKDKLSEDNHILVISIDEFGKYCNDYSKEVVGAALKNIAKILCEIVENGDLVCRYNQSTFMLYFAKKDVENISKLGKILEKQLHKLAIPFENSKEGLLKISSFTNPVSDI